MPRRPLVASLAIAALALAACGGDDDGATAIDEPDTVEETDVAVTADGGGGGTEEPEEPEVPAGGADGTGTFTSGDVTIDGEIVACLLDGNDVSLNLNGENAGVEVTSLGGGQVSVVVTGMVQWSGSGEATVDLGSVSITGTGSLDEPDAPVEGFTLTADIGAC